MSNRTFKPQFSLDNLSIDTLELLTPDEAADRLGITRRKAIQMFASGLLPAFKIGRCWRVPKDIVQQYVQALAQRVLNQQNVQMDQK